VDNDRSLTSPSPQTCTACGRILAVAHRDLRAHAAELDRLRAALVAAERERDEARQAEQDVRALREDIYVRPLLDWCAEHEGVNTSGPYDPDQNGVDHAFAMRAVLDLASRAEKAERERGMERAAKEANILNSREWQDRAEKAEKVTR